MGAEEEFPAVIRRLQGPLAAGGSGDDQDEGGAVGPEMAVEVVRESADEAVEDRVVEFGGQDAGAADGKANLLLVMPAFGEFAGGVEPV